VNDFDSTEMFVKILRKIHDGSSPHLSDYLSLTPWQLQKYLDLLEKNSLIERARDSGWSVITQKGIEYLHAHDRFIELLLKK
jgi:predicted transcriptional regulator